MVNKNVCLLMLVLLAAGLAQAQDSLNCRLVGNWPFGACHAVALDFSRNIAFCGSGGGVYVLDVSNQAQPVMLSDAIRTPGVVRDLCCLGYRLYIAADKGGMEIWDVATPSSPSRLSRFATPGNALRVSVVGDLAYVAAGEAGLFIVDVSDPEQPRQLSSRDSAGYTKDVQIVGDLAYVAGMDSLRVLDVSDPLSPREVGSFDMPRYTIDAVRVVGNCAYLAGHGEAVFGYLGVVDVTDPRNLRELGCCGTPGPVSDVTVVGHYALVADSDSGLVVIDVSNPKAPLRTGSGIKPGRAARIVTFGSRAYVAAEGAGLRILDISDPRQSRELGSFATPSRPCDACVAGNRAFVADMDFGLYVLDISNPQNPREVGRCQTPGGAWGVDVLGTYAYVAAAHSGLRVIDLVKPENPREVGAYDTPGYAERVHVVGTYAYVADGDSGLRVIDVADPRSPREVGSCSTFGAANDVCVARGYAYMADGDSGLCVVDVSTPRTPRRDGHWVTPGPADAVSVLGNYAYVADENALRVIYVSDPHRPVGVGSYVIPSAQGVSAVGSCVYVVGDSGLRVISVSDPENPREVGFHTAPGYSSRVRAVGACAYVDGCHMYEFTGEGVNDTVSVLPRDSSGASQTPILDGGAESPGQRSPNVASGDSGFLVVWNDGRVCGARVTAEGKVLDRSGIVISPPDSGEEWEPEVAYGGKVFLIVWNGVSGARVTREGAALDSLPIAISKRPYGILSSVAFGGTSYLVLIEFHTDSLSGVYGARVTPEGAVLDSSPIVIPNPAGSVAFGGTSYLAVWVQPGSDSLSGVYGTRVTSEGRVLDPSGIAISVSPCEHGGPAVAFDGSNYLVVWSDIRASSGSDIYAARITPQGTVLDPSGIPVSTATGDQWSPTLAFDGANCLVVWSDERSGEHPQIFGARVTPQGAVLDPAAIALAVTDPGLHLSPAVASNGDVSLVVWSRGWGVHNIFGTRVARDGSVLDPSGIPISRPDPSRSRWR